MTEDRVAKRIWRVITETISVLIDILLLGEANNETLALMGKPRCGVSDINSPIINRRKRYATNGGFTNSFIGYAANSRL